jgi:hypothetical protein
METAMHYKIVELEGGWRIRCGVKYTAFVANLLELSTAALISCWTSLNRS